MIYLLHFEKPFKHARHYIGFCLESVEKRIERHRAGNGAKLLRVVSLAGIAFQVARTWEGDRHAERKLKRRKNAKRLCPLCKNETNERKLT